MAIAPEVYAKAALEAFLANPRGEIERVIDEPELSLEAALLADGMAFPENPMLKAKQQEREREPHRALGTHTNVFRHDALRSYLESRLAKGESIGDVIAYVRERDHAIGDELEVVAESL